MKSKPISKVKEFIFEISTKLIHITFFYNKGDLKMFDVADVILILNHIISYF